MKTTADVPENRFCDLIMNGGITSGVIYPPAICELAAHYRFKNIGGASAGAIAAVLAAAAEYRRCTTGTMDGFKYLERITEELGAHDVSGGTQLLRLFQPDRQVRRLFRVLIGALNAGGTFQRVRLITLGLISNYWHATLFSVIVSTLAVMASGAALEGILVFMLLLSFSLALVIYRDVTRSLVRNNYGLCKGMTTIPEVGPALTPWLHARIQEAAGLPLDEPLTFGYLWRAPRGPAAQTNSTTGARSIDLRMFTTNLSHGRPYIFPHTENTARLFYRHDELAAYLPPEVLRWMDEHALEYVPNPLSPGRDPTVDKAQELGLKEMPPPHNFPVLLAARMSLSFPVLFATVPLWAIDYEDPRAERTFRRCLFLMVAYA